MQSFWYHRRGIAIAINVILGDIFLSLFSGTPVLLAWLRLLGVHIDGWRCYVESTFFTGKNALESIPSMADNHFFQNLIYSPLGSK